MVSAAVIASTSGHLSLIGQVGGIGHPVQVTRVQDDQPPSGIQDIDRADIVSGELSNRTGEHGGHPKGIGQG